MKRPLMLAIRNINLVFVLLLLIGLFLVDKQTCAYFGLEVVLGIDIIIQSSSIIWHPDLFLYFISIFGWETNNLPVWNDINFPQKLRLGIAALFFLACGAISIYTGWTKFHTYSCI